jgi:K+-sensing histidine kinase KdpD
MTNSQEVTRTGAATAQQDGTSKGNPAALDVRTVDEFLSSISHDLKGPLSVILIQAQLAQRELQDATLREGSRLPDHLAGIVTMCQKMSVLIEDLMDVARAQMGQPIALSLQQANLVVILQRVVDRHAGRGECPIELATHQAELGIQADVPRVERVFETILSTADKTCAAGATICVEADRVDDASGHWAAITIGATGPDDQVLAWRMVLDRFMHLGKDTGVRNALGLSWLSVVQTITQHGGNIQADVTTGAKLILRFPLVDQSAHMERDAG